MPREDRVASMRDRVRARAEKRKSEGGGTVHLPDGVESYEFEKGKNRINILPYEVKTDHHPEAKKGELWYERTFFVHFNVGPDERAMVCPRTIGKACPICEEHTRLRKDPDADEDVVKGLRAKERQLFNVEDADHPKDGVKVLEISYHNFGKQLEKEVRDGDESNASFADLEEGKTLLVRMGTATMGKTKFLQAERIDFEDRDKIPESVLDDVVDLDACLTIPSYEELQKAMLGMEDEEKGRGTRGEGKDDDRRSSRRERDEDEDPDKDKDDDRRGGRRERDEDEDGRRDRRGRGDEDPDDKDKRKGRDREDDPDPEPERRGRRPARDEEPTSRRGSRKDEEKEPDADEPEERTGRRRRYQED